MNGTAEHRVGLHSDSVHARPGRHVRVQHGTQTSRTRSTRCTRRSGARSATTAPGRWGISRLIDGIMQVKDQLKVDPTKIAVQGCSYAGKMALFGGALDERVALTVAEESGGGGINSWRTSQDFTTRTGTSVEKIDNTNYAWFMIQHEEPGPLQAAPRSPRAHRDDRAASHHRLGNPSTSGWVMSPDTSRSWPPSRSSRPWASPTTSATTSPAATPLRGAATQTASVKTFVDRYLKGGTSATNIAIKPHFDANSCWTPRS